LSAVKGEVITDEASHLYIDLLVVVLEDLLNDIIAELIVDQTVKLGEAHIDQRALDGRFIRPKDFLHDTTPVLVSSDLGAMAEHGSVDLFLVLVRS
jgi:hypothetical protein